MKCLANNINPTVPVFRPSGYPPSITRPKNGIKGTNALSRQFPFFVRQGRGVSHTPSLTSPPRGRMPVPGSIDGYFTTTIRALSCPIGGRMQYAPTLTAKKKQDHFLNSYIFSVTLTDEKNEPRGRRGSKNGVVGGRGAITSLAV